MTDKRRPLIAGNWKMNGLKASANELAAIGQGAEKVWRKADLLICPPATLLFTDSNGLASATLPLPSFMIPWPLFVQAIVFDPNGGYSRFGYQLSSSAGRAVRIF